MIAVHLFALATLATTPPQAGPASFNNAGTAATGQSHAFLEERCTMGDILRFANAAAALKCGALGRRGCPRKPEVDALLARV